MQKWKVMAGTVLTGFIAGAAAWGADAKSTAKAPGEKPAAKAGKPGEHARMEPRKERETKGAGVLTDWVKLGYIRPNWDEVADRMKLPSDKQAKFVKIGEGFDQGIVAARDGDKAERAKKESAEPGSRRRADGAEQRKKLEQEAAKAEQEIKAVLSAEESKDFVRVMREHMQEARDAKVYAANFKTVDAFQEAVRKLPGLDDKQKKNIDAKFDAMKPADSKEKGEGLAAVAKTQELYLHVLGYLTPTQRNELKSPARQKSAGHSERGKESSGPAPARKDKDARIPAPHNGKPSAHEAAKEKTGD